jgi:hypothetical protein
MKLPQKGGKMDQQLKELQKALKLLAVSDTYRKRYNARVKFRTAERKLRMSVDDLYPKLRKDGSKIETQKQKGYSCPYCRRPVKNIEKLLSHFIASHKWDFGRCICGWSKERSVKRLRLHLAAQEDLTTHIMSAVLKNATKPAKGPLTF